MMTFDLLYTVNVEPIQLYFDYRSYHQRDQCCVPKSRIFTSSRKGSCLFIIAYSTRFCGLTYIYWLLPCPRPKRILLAKQFRWHACLSASSFLNLRPVLLVLHQTRDLIELGLEPLIGSALVQQLLSLLLESPSCRRQIEHLRQSTAISIVYLLQLRSQIAVELVHKRQKEEAKGGEEREVE